MSLWVRSQDKKTLVKVDMVELLNFENFIVAYTSIKVVDLGKYSTKEKALKVLDMLQMCITGEIAFKREYLKKFRDIGMGTYSAREFVKEMQRQVFQMPQDDEVEE